MMSKVLVTILIALALPSVTFADADGLFLTEGLIGYNFTIGNTNTAVTSRTLLSSETGLGYIISGWFYLGVIYNYTSINETETDYLGTNTNHQETYQYYGPTIGYMGDHFFVLVNYLANAEKKDNLSGGAQGNYDNTGTGYGLNLGYRFNLGDSFDIAPVLAYKNVTYTNCKNPYTGAPGSCNPSINQSDVTPYVTLLFNFK